MTSPLRGTVRQHALINGQRTKMLYDVEYLNHDYFLNYKENLLFSSIRPRIGENFPTVNNIRSLIYLLSGNIFFKTDYNEEYQNMNFRELRSFDVKYSLKPLFLAKLAITCNIPLIECYTKT